MGQLEESKDNLLPSFSSSTKHFVLCALCSALIVLCIVLCRFLCPNTLCTLCIVQHSQVLCYTVLYCAILRSTVLYNAIICSVVMH